VTPPAGDGGRDKA